MVPGVMFDGQAQKKISLYTYTLIYTCAFVSIMEESQFAKVERLLFQNTLNENHWNSLLASDILCFIAR